MPLTASWTASPNVRPAAAAAELAARCLGGAGSSHACAGGPCAAALRLGVVVCPVCMPWLLELANCQPSNPHIAPPRTHPRPPMPAGTPWHPTTLPPTDETTNPPTHLPPPPALPSAALSMRSSFEAESELLSRGMQARLSVPETLAAAAAAVAPCVALAAAAPAASSAAPAPCNGKALAAGGISLQQERQRRLAAEAAAAGLRQQLDDISAALFSFRSSQGLDSSASGGQSSSCCVTASGPAADAAAGEEGASVAAELASVLLAAATQCQLSAAEAAAQRQRADAAEAAAAAGSCASDAAYVARLVAGICARAAAVADLESSFAAERASLERRLQQATRMGHAMLKHSKEAGEAVWGDGLQGTGGWCCWLVAAAGHVAPGCRRQACNCEQSVRGSASAATLVPRAFHPTGPASMSDLHPPLPFPPPLSQSRSRGSSSCSTQSCRWAAASWAQQRRCSSSAATKCDGPCPRAAPPAAAYSLPAGSAPLHGCCPASCWPAGTALYVSLV